MLFADFVESFLDFGTHKYCRTFAKTSINKVKIITLSKKRSIINGFEKTAMIAMVFS